MSGTLCTVRSKNNPPSKEMKSTISLFYDYRSRLFLLISALFFHELDFRDFKLGKSHERQTWQADEHHLKCPKAHVRDWRKSVVTNVLTTRLIRIAAKRALNWIFEKNLFHDFSYF